MQKNKLLLAVITLSVVIAVFVLYKKQKPEVALASDLDDFAQCLADKKLTMYGAYWCPHCQNEKKAFGESFQYVPYVECTDEPTKCLNAGVTGYPTWISDDGKKFIGEQGIDRLAVISGCSLPNKK